MTDAEVPEGVNSLKGGPSALLGDDGEGEAVVVEEGTSGTSHLGETEQNDASLLGDEDWYTDLSAFVDAKEADTLDEMFPERYSLADSLYAEVADGFPDPIVIFPWNVRPKRNYDYVRRHDAGDSSEDVPSKYGREDRDRGRGGWRGGGGEYRGGGGGRWRGDWRGGGPPHGGGGGRFEGGGQPWRGRGQWRGRNGWGGDEGGHRGGGWQQGGQRDAGRGGGGWQPRGGGGGGGGWRESGDRKRPYPETDQDRVAYAGRRNE